MVFILKRDPYFDNMLLNCWNSWSVWVYGSHEVLTFPSSELDMAGWSEMQILHSEVRWAGYGWHQASCTPKVNRVNSGVIPKAIQGPVLLLLRSDTVASLLANGSAAFIWKLHCHWLRGLPERHITVLTHWGQDKWPPFSRRHFQMHFLEWKCINFDSDFTEVCSQGSN